VRFRAANSIVTLRCPAFSINLGHQQPYVDDDVHIYSSATMRPSRPTYAEKPNTLYDPSYAIWQRPNDLAIGHDRPYATIRPYHTVQDHYPQNEYESGYPATSGVHVPMEDSSSNAVDYSRYRGNRMKNARGDIVAPECRTRCASSAPSEPRRDFARFDRSIPKGIPKGCASDMGKCEAT